jgi:PAS domain S-box-containing protein
MGCGSARSPRSAAARVRALLTPSTRPAPGVAVALAAGSLIGEAILVVLLKQVDPNDPVGILYAVLMGLALTGNFVAGVAVVRVAAADRRREAELAAELARVMLRAGDLRTAAEEAARHLAVALSMRFASVELEGAAVHSARVAVPLRADDVVLGFLQVPDDLPRVTRQRLLRLLPTFEALLAAARERENINKRFIESRQRLERFFDLSSDLMVISDQANFLQVNPAFERTLGYTADDLAPAPFDLIWPEDRDLLREPVKELTDGGRPVRYENRATSRDGSPRWLEWSVAPHQGLFYAVGRDVTKQRTEQEQLRNTHAMLEASRDALRTLAEQQAALRRIATLVAQGVSPGEVFCAVAEEMGRCIGVEGTAVSRLDREEMVLMALPPVDDIARDTLPVGVRFPLDGDNVVTRVVHTGRPARMDSQEHATGAIAVLLRGLGVRSVVAVPIIVDGKVWGMATAGTGETATSGGPRAPELLPADTEERLADFADLLATALANAATKEALQASRDTLAELAEHQAGLRRVATLVARGDGPVEVFEAVYYEMARCVHATSAALCRYEDDRTVTTLAARHDPGMQAPPGGIRVTLEDEPILAAVFSTGQPARQDGPTDTSNSVNEAIPDAGVGTALGVPVIVDGRVWGAISAASSGPEPLPSDTETRIADFADLVATAVANTAAREQLKASRDSLRQLARQQTALRRVAELVAGEADPADVFSAVAEEMAGCLDAYNAVVLRYEGDEMVVEAIGRIEPDVPNKPAAGERFPVDGDNVGAMVRRTGGPARMDSHEDAAGPAAARTREVGAQSMVGVPIVVGAQLWGVAVVASRTGPLPADTEARGADFADLVGTSIANAATRGELQASGDSLRQLARQQTALRRVAELVAREAEPAEVFNAVAEEMANCLDVYNATVARYEGDAIVIAALGRPELELSNRPAVGDRFPLDGDHVAAIVRRTGRPARMDSHEHAAGAAAARIRGIGIQAMVAVPVLVGGHLWGVSAVASRDEPLPADTEVRIADFADLVATAIANAAAREQLNTSRDSLRQLARQQTALRRVAELVAREAEPRQVFNAVADEMASCLDAYNANVARFDGDAIVIEALGRPEFDLPNLPAIGQRFPLDGGHIAPIIQRTGRPARLDSHEHAAGATAAFIRELGIQSMVGVPIVVGAHVWGVAAVASRTQLPAETEARMADFADLVATSIANAATRAELQTSRDSLRELADSLSVLARQQAALRRVATLVASGVSQSEVFSAVAEEMAGCLDVGNAEVLRYEDDGASIVVVACYAAPGVPHLLLGERLSVEGDNVAAMVLGTRKPARMDSWEGAAGPIAERVRKLGIRSRIGAPIVVDERVWGIAIVATTQADPLPPDTEARIAEFAELVATAIAAATTRAELIASRARIVAAADDARRRLERDIHDGAQQRLVSLGLKLRLAEDSLPSERDDLKATLCEAVSGLTDVFKELQEISRGIHPAILSTGGLQAAFKTLARRSAVPVDLDVAIEQRLPDSVEVAAYYVVAEALTNAAKHAHASEVKVRVYASDETLTLFISDDGIGGADSRKGSGLIGLKDRIEVLGGRMHVASPPGGGTAIDITIPHKFESVLHQGSATPNSDRIS